MDEFTLLHLRATQHRGAQRALAKRLGLPDNVEVEASAGLRWRLVRRPWPDQELLSVELLDFDHEVYVHDVIDVDPEYLAASHTFGEQHQFSVYDKSLRAPDRVVDCRYLVCLRTGPARDYLWCASFKDKAEAAAYATEQAKAFLDARNVQRLDATYSNAVYVTNYVRELTVDTCHEVNDVHGENFAEIFVTTVDYGEEFPFNHEQEKVA